MTGGVRKVLLSVIASAVVVLLAISFFHFYEKVESKRWKPFTGEARKNPLFAGRLFLKQMGIPSYSSEGFQVLNNLPSTDSVIVMTASRHNLPEDKSHELLAWVEQGGHLLVSNTEYWGSNYVENNTPLVDESENSEHAIFSNDVIQKALKVHINTQLHIDFEPEKPRAIQLPNAPKPLELSHNYYPAIILNSDNKSEQLETVKLDGKNIIIRQVFGKGLITLASDLQFIEYRELGNADQAEIFWYLIHRDKTVLTTPSAVWLIHSDKSVSLFTIAWSRFWPVVLMLSILLLAWVLRVSRRFGPLIPKQGEDRRQLMDHIEASGAYYWEQKQSDTLVDSTRAAANYRLSQRIPGWQSLTKDQQAENVAKRLKLNTQQVFQTLHGNVSHSPHNFTETIKQLEYIRTNV